MIISRAPYSIALIEDRITHATDPSQTTTVTLALSYQHYSYLSYHSPFSYFQKKSRIITSHIEDVSDHQQITHPMIRAILTELNASVGVEIIHQSDIPFGMDDLANPALTTSLIHAIYTKTGIIATKRQLAAKAIEIQAQLNQASNLTAQIATTYGGLNKITLHPNQDFNVTSLTLPFTRQQLLEEHLLLFFLDHTENQACQLAKKPTTDHPKANDNYFVDEAVQILTSLTRPITELGELMHQAWSANDHTATPSENKLNLIYRTAQAAGAMGGKLFDAGRTRFMLFFAGKPGDRARICAALDESLLIPFAFEYHGSQIIFCGPMHEVAHATALEEPKIEDNDLVLRREGKVEYAT